VNVIRAAEIGAFSAIDMRNAHFGAVPKLRARANELLVNDPPAAKAIAVEVLSVPDVDELLETLQPI
jgi:hypothetical protein